MTVHPSQSRFASILLALMLLATTVAPAIADSGPTAKPAPRPASYLYMQAQQRKPGALLAVQLDAMRQSLASELEAYAIQTGGWPASSEQALAAGFLPFVPLTVADQPAEVVELTQGQHPEGGAIGLRLRDKDATLIAMGADGDELAALSVSVDRGRELPPAWAAPYSWQHRQRQLAGTALVALCEAHLNLTGVLPESIEALEAVVGLTPRYGHWQPKIDSQASGIALEVDSISRAIRITQYPDPGYGQRRVYAWLQSNQHLMLQAWPYGLIMPVAWRPLGMLVLPPMEPEAVQRVPALPAELPKVGFTFPQPMLASLQLTSELSQIAIWRTVATGPTTADWLSKSNLSLHLPLDSHGEQTPMTAHALAPWTSLAMDSRPPLPEGALLDLASDDVYFVPALDLTFETKDAAGAATSYGLRDNPIKRSVGRRDPSGKITLPAFTLLMDEDSMQVEARLVPAHSPLPVPDSVASGLWEAHEKVDVTGHPYRYLSMGAEAAKSLLGRALQLPIIPSGIEWDAEMRNSGLAPHRYRFLAADAASAPGTGVVELALTSDRQVARITTRHPDGLQKVEYQLVVVSQTPTTTFMSFRAVDPLMRPEIPQRDYETIATMEITIPDWTEVATP